MEAGASGLNNMSPRPVAFCPWLVKDTRYPMEATAKHASGKLLDDPCGQLPTDGRWWQDQVNAGALES